MSLFEIASIYTDLVKAEEKVPEEEYQAKDLLNALRTKYHQMLMDKMREEGVYFMDRFDATRWAFQMVTQALYKPDTERSQADQA